ncbi:MAG: MarR family winged helix-turn-helix transcriptional regulator [Aquabacterium sp.]
MSTLAEKQRELDASRAVAVTAAFLEAVCELADDWTITAPQVNLLLQLRIHGEIAQQDLERFTRVKKSANSRNIQKLGMGENPLKDPGPGYVETSRDLKDRRVQVVRLTQRGLHLMEEAAKRAARFLS